MIDHSMRMYPLAAPRPAVFVFEDEPTALIAASDIHEEMSARTLDAFVTQVGSCVVFPPPYEVRRGFAGRTLRDEEYAEYAAACTELAAFMAPTSVRIAIQEMHVFDWHAFTKADWSVLERLYPTLPGWFESVDLPRWFGPDEQTGPYLCVSVEPPGLQLSAIAEQGHLDEWCERFAAGTARLPVRDLM